MQWTGGYQAGFTTGAEVLVQNYPDVETEKLTALRPFEVVAYLK